MRGAGETNDAIGGREGANERGGCVCDVGATVVCACVCVCVMVVLVVCCMCCKTQDPVGLVDIGGLVAQEQLHHRSMSLKASHEQRSATVLRESQVCDRMGGRPHTCVCVQPTGPGRCVFVSPSLSMCVCLWT